jgi:hypothetical protein
MRPDESRREDRPELVDIEVGQVVLTHEGRRLGTITEVHTTRFRIDDPELASLWFDRETVLALTEEGCVVEYSPQQRPDPEQRSERDVQQRSGNEVEYTSPDPGDIEQRAGTSDGEIQMQVGLPVITRNGDPLGTIKEIRTERFKVDAPMALDYWLDRETVIDLTADGYVLDFDSDDLDEMKRSDPGAPGSIPATSLQDKQIPKVHGDESPPSHT